MDNTRGWFRQYPKASIALGVILVLIIFSAMSDDSSTVQEPVAGNQVVSEPESPSEPVVEPETTPEPEPVPNEDTQAAVDEAEEAFEEALRAAEETIAENGPTNASIARQNAVEQASSYLETAPFSKSGLVEQLEYEGYNTSDAEYAVDWVQHNRDVSWKQQAALQAESYLETASFSRSGLIEQLEYEGYSTQQATYGVDQAGL